MTADSVCSRWKKAKGLVKRPEYAKMKHVRLAGDLKSSFWRHHTKGVEEDGVSPCTRYRMDVVLPGVQYRPCS